MVALDGTQAATAVAPPIPAATRTIDAATEASIDAYLGAGDGMRALMDHTMKVCAALLVLVALAWALGLLPGAVRLF